ncbi:unnamed protein product [Arctogadus glacialis]
MANQHLMLQQGRTHADGMTLESKTCIKHKLRRSERPLAPFSPIKICSRLSSPFHRPDPVYTQCTQTHEVSLNNIPVSDPRETLGGSIDPQRIIFIFLLRKCLNVVRMVTPRIILHGSVASESSCDSQGLHSLSLYSLLAMVKHGHNILRY